MGKAASKLDEAMAKVAGLRLAAPDTPRPPSTKKNPWKAQEVRETPELRRVLALPRRDWEAEAEELAEELTLLLKRDGGEQKLRPIQAYLLRELYVYRGAIGVVRVGGGKSLPTFLAPYVVKAFRPLLVVPGALVDKTERHMKRDAYHWEIPNFIRVESYEKLGHPDNGDLLYKYKPDLVMLDEGSKCKNTRAVVTSRIGYYAKDCRRGYYKAKHPEENTIIKVPLDVKLMFLVLSGTLTVRSLMDYWHILRWVMPDDDVPLPNNFSEIIQWAMALDANIEKHKRVKPGALKLFYNEEEEALAKTDSLKATRRAFRRRFLSTPRIVSTSTPFLGASLYVKPVRVKAPEEVVQVMKLLRSKWRTPDNQYIEDAHVAAMHARWLALGYYERWNPRPPLEYIVAKKEWSKACRKIISTNKSRIDSAGQVVAAMEKEGKYPEAFLLYKKWKEWDKTFKVNVETVWISNYALQFATNWAKKKENKRGIIWCTDRAFGHKLAEVSGLSYYADKSLDKNGRYIEDHPPNTPMIASVKANAEGKNLQYGWSKNLLMGAIGSGEGAEQWLGRTHRDGQPEDTVTAELFWACLEHAAAIHKAIEESQFADDTETARKLVYADVDIPSLESVTSKTNIMFALGDIEDGLKPSD